MSIRPSPHPSRTTERGSGLGAATLVLLLTAPLVLAGCDRTPTLDGSSPEALQATAAEVRATLPPDRHEPFDRALERVRDAGAEIDGWTAEQVISEADVLRRAAEERELARLEKQAAAHRAARAELDKVLLTEPRLILRRTSTEESANVAVHVENTSGYDISRVVFTARLLSDDAETPLASQERLVHEADLGPGEEARWLLEPDRQWLRGALEAPEDARVELRVIELVGQEGQTLAAERFGPEDQQRLAQLRRRHAEDERASSSA